MTSAVPSQPGNRATAEPTQVCPIQCRGMDEHGQSFADTVHGPVDLADWVKPRYDAGWLMLEVRRGEVEVGGIGRDPNTGEGSVALSDPK